MGLFGGSFAGGWSTNLGGQGHGPRSHWGSAAARGDGWGEEYGAVYNPAAVRRLARYLRPHKGLTGLALVAMIIFAVATYIQPLLIAIAIRDFITTGDLSGLMWLMLGFVGVALLAAAAEFVRQWAMAKVGHRILLRLRREVFDHLLSLSPSFYDKAEVGRVMSRITSDVQVLQELVTSGVLTVVADLVGLGIVIVALLVLDWQLALVTFAVLPLLIAGMIFWSRHARRAFVEVRFAIAAVNGTLNEDLSGVRVVQGLGREEENARRFDQINARNLRATRRAGLLSASVLPAVEVLTAVATAAVIGVAAARLASGDLSPATGIAVIVGFTLYIQRFFDPVRDLVLQYTMFQRAMAGAERIFEVLDTEPAIRDRPDAVALAEVRGEVEFADVSLEYEPGLRALDHINLHVRAGETLALVGETGAGKSSLVALLSRSYDVSDGAVLVDGHDLRDLQRSSLLRRLGVVPQEPFLFSGTVLDNIRYGRPEAGPVEVEQAARSVGVHDWIQRLPQGYQTVLSERGQNLSLGQRQLLALTRAIIADPRILILDEATANVDSRMEALIQEATRRLMRGRTTFVIAHRLSTVRAVDRIVVLQRGRIVESGSHEQLLARNGVYAALSRASYAEKQSQAPPVDAEEALAALRRLWARPRSSDAAAAQPAG